ncbi:5-oxoprolinase subunit PxpB [Salinimicrobium oceani]|uniref:5-oxoprolinase subunit PxpB n=1 Tax=Salinimicrobium oceani TaxID=2722702 RepID=A0ABX1CU67_9FLAO|nr:5-oxoprolinase subunit PxpB [Salinimicrobium oceani]NJW51307.1 5-oxoprolinase subunit PxpB [Salinimicrobium oceani]
MDNFPKIKRLGERAILLEFEHEISPETLKKVLGVKNYLQKNLFKEKIEITNTYNSLLISYPEAIEDVYGDVSDLRDSISTANISFRIESRLFQIPVCYDEVFALDLAEMAESKNLSKKQIVELHSSADYLVYFTGFLPGFLYLGGLPPELHFSRRKHPRSQVQKGTVGIGEKQTGIYPQESPGGWNIIGNSPVPLFDPAMDPPCKFRPGDRIRFYSVSLEEHRRISSEVENGLFRFNEEKYNG